MKKNTMNKKMNAISILTFALAGLSVSPASAQEAVPGLGDIFQAAVPLAALSATYFYEDEVDGQGSDSRGRWMLAKSYATTLGLTYILKNTVNAQRPNGLNDKSFPSGHTASAFAGACFLQERYGWKWGIPAYAAATYTGYSRVANDAHYPRDVIAATAIAALSAHYFTERYGSDISLAPYLQDDTVGVSFSLRF
jgi:membrane-associated phospholipid phosphatase